MSKKERTITEFGTGLYRIHQIGSEDMVGLSIALADKALPIGTYDYSKDYIGMPTIQHFYRQMLIFNEFCITFNKLISKKLINCLKRIKT